MGYDSEYIVLLSLFIIAILIAIFDEEAFLMNPIKIFIPILQVYLLEVNV